MEMDIKSLANLAMFYLKQGNTEKYQSYADQAEASVRALEAGGGSVFSPDVMQCLFQLRRYDVLVDAFAGLPPMDSATPARTRLPQGNNHNHTIMAASGPGRIEMGKRLPGAGGRDKEGGK